MSNRPIVVINAADLPNKVLEVSYEVPTYGDYRKAKKLYPYPTREGEQRPPYSVEELLFSLMLVKISKEGKSIELNSQDIPSRIEPFPIDDRQASMIEFIGTCFIDDDQAKLARSYASQKRNSALEPSVLVPSSITPNGRSYTFQRPNTGVQWRADTNFKGNQENGCTLDEYMMAMCVTHIDNKVIEQPKDPVSLFDDEFIDTVQFLSTIFVNVFLLEEGESEEAKKRGKQKKALRGKLKSVTSKKQDITHNQLSLV